MGVVGKMHFIIEDLQFLPRLLPRRGDTGSVSAAYMQLLYTELCLALDHMPVLPLSVPTSLAGFSITLQVGTFSRQLAVVGLR